MPKKPSHLQVVPTRGKSYRAQPGGNPQQRTDSWENLATMLGTSMDKRTASTSTWDHHPPEFYEQMYAGGGIAARIVDLVPQEALKHWTDWPKQDPKMKEAIEERAQELDLRGNLQKGWTWGRAFGGGCVHIVTNTADPSRPLQRGEKVLALRDFSRWDLRLMSTDIEPDLASPNYGRPRVYYLNLQMGSTYKGYPIHWTRMIRFDGQLVPRRTYIRNGYWHDSILNRLYNSIRNYETANDAAAGCLLDFNVDVYKMKDLASLIQAGQEGVVRDRLELINYAKSAINAMILDADTEEYENKSRSLEGVADLLGKQADRLVADTDIPHTKLLGESPDGSNATGNSTDQAWDDFIGSEQQNYLRPRMQALVDVIYQDIKSRLIFRYRPLRKLSESETADLRQKQSTTDRNYIESGVLDPSEVTQSRFGGEEYSLETTLDQDARDSGEIGAGSNELEESEEGDPEDGDDEGGKPKPGKPAPKDKPKAQDKKDAGDAVTGLSGVEGHPEAEGGIAQSTTTLAPMPKNPKPATETIVGQTMSEPMRDPATDPKLPGPGIPHETRVILPTRGTGMTAPSGYDFQEDPKLSRKRADAAAHGVRAAVVIVRRGDQFLMGKRKDSGKWTFPGGIVDDKESMHQGGVRELREETGLNASKLKFLGSRLVEHEQGKKVQIALYEHQHKTDEKPTGKDDPDKEIGSFRWLDLLGPLPEDIAANLQHPNNVALDHLGLLK